MTELLQILIDAEQKLQIGYVSVYRGEKPMDLKRLDDYQYLQEITNKVLIIATDVTTILEVTND